MNWFLISLLAQFILGTSALADKLLLKKTFLNPAEYAFWLGVLGLVSVMLLPFGFVSVSWQTLGVAVFSSRFWKRKTRACRHCFLCWLRQVFWALRTFSPKLFLKTQILLRVFSG